MGVDDVGLLAPERVEKAPGEVGIADLSSIRQADDLDAVHLGRAARRFVGADHPDAVPLLHQLAAQVEDGVFHPADVGEEANDDLQDAQRRSGRE